ncbi:MAG: ATP-binding protein [Deltaproteobacteria bacterium]|nr:ATP-binding protein [Deltaproteobacteria bacterium]
MNISTSFQVVAADSRAIALLVAALRKLSHDVNNALVSSVSMFDLAVSDLAEEHADLAEGLAPVRPYLSAPRTVFEGPMRTLPTRSMLRPRVLSDWASQIRSEGAKFDTEVEVPADLPEPPIDAADWVQCLDNAVVNALDGRENAQRCGEPQTPGLVRLAAFADGPWCGVRVDDNGKPPADLAAVAAGSTRRSGHGHLGLGLPVAAMHLAAAGGQVHLSPSPLGGVRVELRWPIGLSPRP